MNLSPLAAALLRALRENPTWPDELPSWIAVTPRLMEMYRKPISHKLDEHIKHTTTEHKTRGI